MTTTATPAQQQEKQEEEKSMDVDVATASGQPATRNSDTEKEEEQGGLEEERRRPAEDHGDKENPTTTTTTTTTTTSKVGESSKNEKKHKKASVIFADRKITTEANVDNVSLYAMCRSWFKNETETEDQIEEDKEQHANTGPPLPPPLPAGEALKKLSKATFPFGEEDGKEMDTDDTSKDALFQKHMKRWKAIRKHKMKVKQMNSERFEERLKILFS